MRGLGAEVLVAPPTTKATLDLGSMLDDVCLPVKVYFGHVLELYRQVDYIFAPRIVSVAAGQYSCPQIIGMPDLLRSNIDGLPPMIDVGVNLRQGRRSLMQAVASVGRIFGKNWLASLYAWCRACRRPAAPPLPRPGRAAAAGAADTSPAVARLRVGLIGHPYIIYDQQISMGIIDKLDSLKVDVVTPEMVDRRQAEAAARLLDKKIFWSTSSRAAGAALALLCAAPPVAGLIFMTSFSCGPDALIGELIKQRAQTHNIPCLLLTMDEHTAEAGFLTRLEAFTDMLHRREKRA